MSKTVINLYQGKREGEKIGKSLYPALTEAALKSPFHIWSP